MNPAPSTFAEHKAEAESVNEQRDKANARAQAAWQRCAELESVIGRLLAEAEFPTTDACDDARALLARKRP